MKILHLLASPAYTGPAEVMTQLALAQRALGHDVWVAVDRKRERLSSEEPIVPRLGALGLLDAGPLELSVKSSPLALWRDLRALRRRDVDVVHCHFSHDHLLARLAHGPRVTVIRSIHAPRSVRWSLPAAHGYTVPMDSLARALLGQRVLILPAIVGAEFAPPSDRQALRARLGLPPHRRLAGMVSTFQASRRHALGLEAFAALAPSAPDLDFVLVGDGALEGALRAQAAPLGSRVHFCGYQSGARFIEHLQALDEVWILGLGNDWSARAAAQARACSVRVVAVEEGALPRYADALVAPSVDSLVAAARSNQHAPASLESPESIARRVVDFYQRAGA